MQIKTYPAFRLVEERGVYELFVPETGFDLDLMIETIESKSFKEDILSSNIEQYVREGETSQKNKGSSG